MRLTEKHLRFDLGARLAPLYWINEYDVALECHNGQYGGGNAINKLGQLEDIEDELGIDLITLFKALRQETLFIKTDFDIRETIKNGEGWGMKHLSFEDGEFVIFAQILYPNDITHKEWLTPLRLKLTDYGKTWALTKEELED